MYASIKYADSTLIRSYLTYVQRTGNVDLMPAERRISVGLDEIESIVLECTQCGSRSSIPSDRLFYLPHVCPQGHPWVTGDPTDKGFGRSPFHEFARTIRAIKKLDSTERHEIGFRMLLEFDEPKLKT